MPNPTLQRLIKKTGHEDLLSSLDKLSLSELNSLMLEVFRQRASRQSVKEIMNAYKTNRFVFPSAIDPVSFLHEEIKLLQHGEKLDFKPLALSPLAPLGSTSMIALVDQNKIVSALRGTEVVPDATNVLALEAATQRVNKSFDDKSLHFCTVHRHVRAQGISGKGFTAHFNTFCALSAGKDKGSFSFERQAAKKHIQLYNDYFLSIGLKGIKIIIKSLKEGGKESLLANSIYTDIKSEFNEVDILLTEVPHEEHKYYRLVRFSVNVVHNGVEYNLGDGGLVNWGEKLTGNNKERMFASGLGVEFLLKLLTDKL